MIRKTRAIPYEWSPPGGNWAMRAAIIAKITACANAPPQRNARRPTRSINITGIIAPHRATGDVKPVSQRLVACEASKYD